MVQTIPRLATVGAPAHRHLGSRIDGLAWVPVWEPVLDFILEHEVETHISALFPGLDQLVKSLMWTLDRNVEVVVPFDGYTKLFPAQERECADLVLQTYATVVRLDESVPRYASLDAATKLCIERADALLVLDYEDSTVVRVAREHAKQKNIPIFELNVNNDATIYRCDT